MPDKLFGLVYESWAALDRALTGLTPDEATTRFDGGSSIAWTVGHATHMLDSWIAVRFAGHQPHPVISNPEFRTGGSGEAQNWQMIVAGVEEVREVARGFLDSRPEPDLDRVVPYDGSIRFLRPVGLSLRYAIMRIAAHHFIHVGEITTVRSRLGHALEEPQDWGRALV